MKKCLHVLIIVIAINLFTIQFTHADKKLIFSTFQNSALTLIHEPILREIYKQMGYEIEVRQFPAERALVMANSGKVDGEVARLKIIQEKYKNLVIIPIPLYYSQGAIFTKKLNISIPGYESLKPYEVICLRGYKDAEKQLNKYGVKYTLVNSYSQIFLSLDSERFELGIASRLDGLKIIKELGLKEIKILESSLRINPTYHFIHKKHKHLVPQIITILQKLKEEGFIEKIESKVIQDLTIK